VILYESATLVGVAENKTVWSFSSGDDDADHTKFPDEFRAFDVEGDSAWPSGTLVWIADNTQALVAYDWLLERGWELATTGARDEKPFLDLLSATADK
jgi:hypothetical protein